MWRHVTEFEDKIADYAGSKYAVAMDSCTNAIFMCARYLRKRQMWKKVRIDLPKQIYVSVPQML
jgi:dTDP-4-amino-4,6-dideoxygalactose transaminase